MIRIKEIQIERFRSIINMSLQINKDSNLIAVCGQNNVGKTNLLRAINVFFNPEQYEPKNDMPRIKHATGGGAIHPKITFVLDDDKSNVSYCIVRKMDKFCKGEEDLSGYRYVLKGKTKTDKVQMNTKEIRELLEQIEFVYVESINVLMPELIDKLTNDVIDVQYNKARFSETKKKLKESYDLYVDGLREIMDSFAEDISQTFKDFQPNWSVKFNVPKYSETFRQLISDDVYLQLDDCGSIGIEDKGAGLQRLATILLQFEMLGRLHSKKQVIVCIDEPDVYLHEGLQRKLKKFFDEKSQTMQLIYTTHSKVFINPYNMKNVFLLSANQYTQYSKRRMKEINVVETYLENIENEAGYKKICQHLGIENTIAEPLDKFNLIVEGQCDKMYISELSHFFGIEEPNIIALNGADNAEKYLEFYEAYYSSVQNASTPIIKLLLDNDSKGREVYNKLKSKKRGYKAIKVECFLTQNFLGDADVRTEHNSTNNEIEDLMYPEVICYLINSILPKMKLNKMNVKSVCKNITKKSFKIKGILSLCDHEKDEKNPEEGVKISFCSSSNNTNQFKNTMAEMFKIEANINLLDLLIECDARYPYVREYVADICRPSLSDN